MDTHLDELVDLHLGQHAQRARDVDVDLGMDRLDPGTYLVHEALVGAANRSDDAELADAGLGGLLGGLDQLRDVRLPSVVLPCDSGKSP
nr:hypothetical protein [Aeromicrobium sp.]